MSELTKEEKQKQKRREYYQKNKTEILRKRRQYVVENPEKVIATNAKYYAKKLAEQQNK